MCFRAKKACERFPEGCPQAENEYQILVAKLSEIQPAPDFSLAPIAGDIHMVNTSDPVN